jgi:hypothetical protein
MNQAQQVFARCGIELGDLRWTGRPREGLLFNNQDVLLVPFSLLWGSFAIFWETAMLRNGTLAFVLFGVPFLLAGFYFVIGRFMWDAYRRGKTYYGLTSDSALILQEGLGGGVRRVYLPAVGSLGFSLASDGSGSIAFGDPSPAYWGGYWTLGGGVPSFEGIPDARRVYDLCLRAQHPTRREDAQAAP